MEKADEGGAPPLAPAPSMYERVVATMREMAATQDAEIRKIAMRLLGEDVGDPEELVRRLQENVRRYAGPKASLVLCSVEQQSLAPGVLGEWYLAIDTGGGEGTVPVRIGPPYRILDGGITPERPPAGPSSTSNHSQEGRE